MERYRLLTRWRTKAPLDTVWNLILHSEDWPRWWKGLHSVRELKAGVDGIGNVRHYVWRSALGYRLCFDIESTRVEPRALIEGMASGDVRGWGRWRLREEDGAVEILYEWDVEVVHPTLRRFSPLARPLFKWNHQHLMRLGARGLARELRQRVDCEPVPA